MNVTIIFLTSQIIVSLLVIKNFLWILISLSRYIIFYDTSNAIICVDGIIMLHGFWLFKSQFIHVVAITFILIELLIVALAIRTWHGLLILTEVISNVFYILSLVLLKYHLIK